MLKRNLSLLFLAIILTFTNVSIAKKHPEPVVSTQGFGIVSEQEFMNSEPTKKEKNTIKQEQVTSKKHRQIDKKIKKYNSKKSKTQKEIKYLEKRLNLSKQKLDIINPNTKGVKE